MRNVGVRTRVRAWLLRTFRGRSPADTGWFEELPVSAGAPETFTLDGLTIDVAPQGLKAAGGNRPSVVYEVRLGVAGDPRAWSSRYGLPPGEAGARRAAEAALDELAEIHADPDAWAARATVGMSEEEAEAVADSPAMRLDRRAAEWVGPMLEPLRGRRRDSGSWLSSSRRSPGET